MTPKHFLADLRAEVDQHPAVGHSLLGRMRIDPRDRLDFKIFSGQHFPLVGTFTTYLELLLLSAPSSREKLWLAKVLVDEYGERSDGDDHAEHYKVFMRACGWASNDWEAEPLHPATPAFLREHLELCARGPFLAGLGAVGPGHEWAIPTMFERIIDGLHRAGFAESEINYFVLHTEQDKDHGAWLEEALMELAIDDASQAQIRAGCLASLSARERLWWGIADCINAERMRQHLPWASSSQTDQVRENRAGLRKMLTVHCTIGNSSVVASNSALDSNAAITSH